jgi:7-carboxy-7-deazaguanine synthase (Cx14CxxC type)
VFCRFAGCNLWSGREQDRAEAICTFCDTDFVGTDGTGGGKFPDADAVAAAVYADWGGAGGPKMAVLTGGEPLLQVDIALIEALHARRFEIAVETNGTVAPPPGIDWLCVSPKAEADLAVIAGDELKLVYPQPEALPERFESLDFAHFLLQPMDGPELARNTAAAIAYCMAHPKWRLSVQTHKAVGIR